MSADMRGEVSGLWGSPPAWKHTKLGENKKGEKMIEYYWTREQKKRKQAEIRRYVWGFVGLCVLVTGFVLI